MTIKKESFILIFLVGTMLTLVSGIGMFIGYMVGDELINSNLEISDGR